MTIFYLPTCSLIIGGQILAIPFLLAGGLAGGCVVIPIALTVVAPVYGAYRLRRHINMVRARWRREKEDREEKKLGDPLVFKRYRNRSRYGVGDGRIEISYP